MSTSPLCTLLGHPAPAGLAFPCEGLPWPEEGRLTSGERLESLRRRASGLWLVVGEPSDLDDVLEACREEAQGPVQAILRGEGALPAPLAPPFAVRRALLERLGGFRAHPEGLEVPELGLRLWAEGVPLRRLPLRRPVPPPPHALGVALAWRHPSAAFLAWAAPGGLPWEPRHPAAEIAGYLAGRTWPPLLPAAQYQAGLEGPDAPPSAGGEPRFDRWQAENWIQACLPEFREEVRRTLLLQHPPPALAGNAGDRPLEVELEGRCEVEVEPGLLAELRNPHVVLPLPVDTPEQTVLWLGDADAPLEPGAATVRLSLRGGRAGYAFRCRVKEGLPREEAGEPPPGTSRPRSSLAPRYARLLERLGLSILGPDPLGLPPRERALRLYAWIVDHIPYRANDRMGLFALEAWAGNCAQRLRLFTLLAERAGLEVRDRAGALAELAGSAHAGSVHTGSAHAGSAHAGSALAEPHGEAPGGGWAEVGRVERGHPVMHAWGEVHVPGEGWVPLDFLGADRGSRMATVANLPDPHLRAFLDAWTPRLDAYYFGRVDPYRIHYARLPASLSGLPDGLPDGSLETLRRAAWGTRHTLRLVLRGLPPGTLRPMAGTGDCP